MQDVQKPMTRDEQMLLAYFRALPFEDQMDLLASAEASVNSRERMKELASRPIERTPEETTDYWRH